MAALGRAGLRKDGKPTRAPRIEYSLARRYRRKDDLFWASRQDGLGLGD
jgi:hypothetical protein